MKNARDCSLVTIAPALKLKNRNIAAEMACMGYSWESGNFLSQGHYMDLKKNISSFLAFITLLDINMKHS